MKGMEESGIRSVSLVLRPEGYCKDIALGHSFLVIKNV